MSKKSFWSLLAFMMAAMLSVGFAACGDDDEDEGTGVGNTVNAGNTGNTGNTGGDGNGGGGSETAGAEQLVGTWQKMQDDSEELSNIQWVFEENGTMYEHDLDEDGKIIENKTETFKYKVENSHLYTDKQKDGEYKDDWRDEGAISIANGILTVTRNADKVKRYKKIK